eukprot:6204927-Pleurochrysis_carterae.AAC.4
MHCTRYAGRVAGDAIVLRIVSMSWRSTLASCSGERTKWSLSSAVSGRTDETSGAPVRGAAAGAALAGVERVVGAAAPDAAGVLGKTKVGATGEGASIA